MVTSTSGTVGAAVPGGSGGGPMVSNDLQIQMFGVEAGTKFQVAKQQTQQKRNTSAINTNTDTTTASSHC